MSLSNLVFSSAVIASSVVRGNSRGARMSAITIGFICLCSSRLRWFVRVKHVRFTIARTIRIDRDTMHVVGPLICDSTARGCE